MKLTERYLVENVMHYCNITVNGCVKIQKHIIDYYDLTFIIKGTMTYFINGEKYVLSDNDAVFIKPGTLRERPENKSKVSYISYNFKAPDGVSIDFPPYMKNVITRDMLMLVNAFPYTHLSSLHHTNEKIGSILNCILHEIGDILECGSNNDYILKAIRYTDENINKPISLSDISEELGLSKEYFAYLFKKETGKTVTDYIAERKMQIAEEMLRYDSTPLKNIAEYLGYDNYGYFSRLFKKYYDISPVKFREKFI